MFSVEVYAMEVGRRIAWLTGVAIKGVGEGWAYFVLTSASLALVFPTFMVLPCPFKAMEIPSVGQVVNKLGRLKLGIKHTKP